MEPVCAGLGDIVDLGGAVAPLIHGIGKRVDGDFGNRIEPEDQIGGEPAVEVGERIVGFQTIDDVAVGERRQAVEFHVTVAVRSAHKIIAASGRVDQGAGGKLQGIGQIAPGIGKVVEAGAASVAEVLAFSVLIRGATPSPQSTAAWSHLQHEVHRLFLPQARNDAVTLLVSKPCASSLTE